MDFPKNSLDLMGEVPTNIIKWANLETTMKRLLDNFQSGEERNAELVNKFFNQWFFNWEESLIRKLSEAKPDLNFDDIKNEGINLAVLWYGNQAWDFRIRLNGVISEIKDAFKQEIFNQVQAKIWTWAPYTDFTTECNPNATSDWLWYFEKVVDYLEEKEKAGGNWVKKSKAVLKEIQITNENLNNHLWVWIKIPTGVALSDASVPENTRSSFDMLLSFEIWKEADRTITIAEEAVNQIAGVFSNTIPAVNTIIWNHPEYKYDENNFWDTFQTQLQNIVDNATLSAEEKEKKVNELKWQFYINYLKTKNQSIWNIIEELYNNDFDYTKIDRSTIISYLNTVADIRLRELLSNNLLKSAFWIDFTNIDQFSEYFRNLANPEIDTINLDPTGTCLLRVKKTLLPWPTWLKAIEDYWDRAKSYDTFPIRYEIQKSDVDALPIDMEDRVNLLNFLSQVKSTEEGNKYVIEWADIGKLIYLFFVFNWRNSLNSFDTEQLKKVEELFWEAKDSENPEHNRENWEENPEESNESADTINNFISEVEKLWSGTKFENWAEIWLPICNSYLPWSGYGWMKFKISEVDKTKWKFKWTAFWWELECAWSLEWKSKTFKMNKKTLDDIKNASKDGNKVWLLPNPDKSDFNSFKDGLNNKLWTEILSFPMEWVKWDNDKFTRKITDENGKEKDVEVKYFWASWDDKSTYKVEYKPMKRCFHVSSAFLGDGKRKGWKSEKKRFSYKREMDWNNFLIFYTQKWLIPQTEEESKDAIQRQENDFKMVNGWNWKLNWFSISNIKNSFKFIIWNIKKKIEEYDKSQEEKLQEILISDRWLYSKLWNILWFIPSMKEWFWELQQEHYNERDNRVWKKIEAYLKMFQADPDFWSTFDQVPPHAKIQGWKSLQTIILNRVANAKDRMWDPWIYQAAALLLANIEKWWSPYRGLAWHENEWLWVKALLWKAHYEQFLRDKEACIYDLKKAGNEKDQLQDVLATCEMDYIINNVSWANGKLKYFGSHEWRWLPDESGTDYIDNPSKRILSNQFADKLKWAYKWRFNKSSVEESFEKISHNDFHLAVEDFKRFIKSARYPGAIGNLKKMFLLAKNETQQAEFQKCFLIYMLSWILDFNGKKDLRKQTYQRAKTMGFLPGMLAKETWHSEYVVALLDDFSKNDFSRNVKSFFRARDLKNWSVKLWDLITELDKRRNVDKMNDFRAYSTWKFLGKSFPEGSPLQKLQKSVLDTSRENIDNSLLDNPLVANSWWLISSPNVVRDRMSIDRNWEFEWKDLDERENKARFRNQIAEDVNKMNPQSVDDMKLLLKQYCERFGLYEGDEIFRWIKTAYIWKDRIWKEYTYESLDRNNRAHKDSMWKITQKEIDSIIWYAFQWKAMSRWALAWHRLPKELKIALETFQKKFKEAFYWWTLQRPQLISEVFNVWNERNVTPMWLWSWDMYNRTVVGREYSYDDSGEWNEWKDRYARIKRNFTWWNFINYEIANIEKSFKNLSTSDYMPVTKLSTDDLMARFHEAAA